MSNIFTRMDEVCGLELPRAEKAIFKRLVERASPQNKYICWPSVASLASDTGYSERTVQGALKRLEDLNFVTRHFRCGKSTRYHVHPHLGLKTTTLSKNPELRPAPAKHKANPCKRRGETEKNKNLNGKGGDRLRGSGPNRNGQLESGKFVRHAAPTVGHLANRFLKSLPPPGTG